jgi:hypothetical protein
VTGMGELPVTDLHALVPREWGAGGPAAGGGDAGFCF